MPNLTASLLYISSIVWAKITKFYRHIHADLPYICTRNDVTNFFRSESTAKNPLKMPHQTASCGISRERFKRWSQNFTRLSGTTGARKMLDMTSLVTSHRLQSAIKYWTKVVMFRPTKESNNSATDNPDPLRVARTSVPSLWPHQVLLISIYQSSKNGRKCGLRRLWVEF